MNTDFAIMLIDKALKKGANEAEIFIKSSKNLSIEIKDQKIDTLESSFSSGYSIRVIKDYRLGFSYSTDIKEADSIVDNALEASRYSAIDEYLGLPDRSLSTLEVKIFDDNISSLSEEEAFNMVMLIESSALKADKRVKKTRKTSGSFSVNKTTIVNSKGVNISYSSTACAAQIMVIAEDGNESQMAWDYQGSRFLKDIKFEDIGEIAAKKAVQLLGARKISPIKGFVLLDNSVASEFLRIFSSALSSESVQKKRSMLAGKKGELVLSERLNIIDNGLFEGKLGTRPVDDEGVPTTNKILIEKGILKGYIYNTYTANKEKILSTGNATRSGFSGIPSVGITNLYAEPSSEKYESPFNEIIKKIDHGIYVTETMGMHTANPISGEFSVGVTGLWIEKGEMAYPFKEAVISGNVLDLFKNIVLVGDDMRFYGNIGTPSLLIEGVDISG